MDEESKKIAVAMHAERASNTEIARTLGTTKQNVAYWLNKLGVRAIKSNRPQPERDAAVAAAYADGATSSEISERFNIAVAWVPTIVRRCGVEIRRVGGRTNEVEPESQARILELWQEGKAAGVIQKLTGVHIGRVKRVLREEGLKFERRRQGQRGGTIKAHGGYLAVRVFPADPLFCMADVRGYVPEHRYVMARKLGRPLTEKETVHHKNGLKRDNDPENLQLRQGKHGKNECFECGDCGSRNVKAVSI